MVKIIQTDTGGHRPTNNSYAEKRIGLLVACFGALLYTATGGGRYCDQLWGPGIRHANRMLNASKWTDDKSPYETRVGKTYDYTGDYIFGA